MRYLLLACLVGCALAQTVTVHVWNGIPDSKALFYGYLGVQGGFPIARGSTLWIPVVKGETVWSLPAVSPADDSMTLSGDFNVDPNLFYDQQHDQNRLLIPRLASNIHCELRVRNFPSSFGVLLIENPKGFASKYGCSIHRWI